VKLLLSLFSLVFLSISLFAGTPIIDGQFDGESVWGTPKALGDMNYGWAGANAKRLYVTNDNNYFYLGAEMTASSWQNWVFIVHTKSGGASSDSWSRNIVYNHLNKPDYTFRGTFDGWCEYHSWNGVGWNGIGSGIAATEYAENITGNDQNGFVELRIPRAFIDNASIGDVQFYITGNNNEHGCFDAIPSDDNATSWSDQSVLGSYQEDLPLPVEMASFSVAATQNQYASVRWTVQSEIEMAGYNVLRGSTAEVNSALKVSSTIEAQNSSQAFSYQFVDYYTQQNTDYYYWLEAIGLNGVAKTYGPVYIKLSSAGNQTTPPVIEQETSLRPAFPNPFQSSTTINFNLKQAARITLAVYNVKGEKIQTLRSEETAKGYHQVVWNGRDVNGNNMPAGLYFIRMTGTDTEQIQKVILVK